MRPIWRCRTDLPAVFMEKLPKRISLPIIVTLPRDVHSVVKTFPKSIQQDCRCDSFRNNIKKLIRQNLDRGFRNKMSKDKKANAKMSNPKTSKGTKCRKNKTSITCIFQHRFGIVFQSFFFVKLWSIGKQIIFRVIFRLSILFRNNKKRRK